MWIYLSRGHFSIVEDKDNPKRLVVRARIKEDLEHYFPFLEPIETEDSDYRFRVFVPRVEVADLISREIIDIDYTNFKNTIPKSDPRYSWYSRVWVAGAMEQDRKYGYVSDLPWLYEVEKYEHAEEE